MGDVDYWLARDNVVRCADDLYVVAHAGPGEAGELAAAWRTEAEYQALLVAVEEMRQLEAEQARREGSGGAEGD